MKIRLIVFLSVVFLGLFATSSNAVTPQVRFPEWCKPGFHVQSWNPELRTLTIRTSLQANKILLNDVSSKIFWPANFSTSDDEKVKKVINLNEKIDFYHTAIIKYPFNGWIECRLKALPTKEGMMALISKQYAAETLAYQALKAEVAAMNSPKIISRTLPIYVDRDIAFAGTKELALKPLWKDGKKASFYFWYPPNTSSSITGEALKTLSQAIHRKKLSSIKTISNLLIKRLEKSSAPLDIADEETHFYMPSKVAISLIKANLLSVRIINNMEPSILEPIIDNLEPSFSRGFVYANFATACRARGKADLAVKYYTKALEDIPAWPLVKKWLKDLK